MLRDAKRLDFSQRCYSRKAINMYATLVTDKRTQLAYGILLLTDAMTYLAVDSAHDNEIDTEKILSDKIKQLRKEYSQ